MRYSNFNKVITAIALLTLCFTCKQKETNTAGAATITGGNSGYDKVEIYCWCYGPLDTVRRVNQVLESNMCNTLIQVKPAALIKPGNFVYVTEDKNTISHLERVVNKHSRSVPAPFGIDCRLVVLFRKGIWADTLATDYPGQFYYNGTLREFPFPLMDSISRIVRTKITCPD